MCLRRCRLLSLGAVVAAALVIQWLRSDVVTSIVAAAELGILGVVALAELMSPLYLASGSDDAFGTVMAAVLLVALLSAALTISGRPDPTHPNLLRAVTRWSIGGVCLLASSILLVTALSPTPGVGSATQNGQLALSTYWGIVGLAAIIWGLARGVAVAHRAGASLLAVAGAKVLLLDTQQLEAAYRTGVFIGVGLIMLIGGFAYLRNASESAGE